jgi:hypothetical protein
MISKVRTEQITIYLSALAGVVSLAVAIGVFFSLGSISKILLSLFIGFFGSILGGFLAYFFAALSKPRPDVKVFISYTQQDRQIAIRLSKALRNAGFQAVIDQNTILIGDNIEEKIREGIKDSQFFVIILSTASVDSSWIEKELNLARSMSKLIIPVLVEKVTVPESIADIQYADLSEDFESGFSVLRRSLRAHARRLKEAGAHS